MEIIIYLVLCKNGYTPKNGVFNRPFFSLFSLRNCSGSLKLIGALACKLQNEPKNDPLSAILMEQIEIIEPPLFGKNPSKKGNWLSQDPVIRFPWGLAHSVGKIDQKFKIKKYLGVTCQIWQENAYVYKLGEFEAFFGSKIAAPAATKRCFRNNSSAGGNGHFDKRSSNSGSPWAIYPETPLSRYG